MSPSQGTAVWRARHEANVARLRAVVETFVSIAVHSFVLNASGGQNSCLVYLLTNEQGDRQWKQSSVRAVVAATSSQ